MGIEENYLSFLSENHQYSEVYSPPAKPKRKLGGWRSIYYILGNESFEKLASMSLVANITVYLSTKYNMSGVFLVTVVNVWGGFSNITSLGGAFVSDAYLGKFYTLLYGSIASLLGMGLMTLTAGISSWRPIPCNQVSAPGECTQEAQAWQLGIVFGALCLLSVGAGGIRPCNIAFGADQFDTNTPKGKAQLESFFNWWYFTFTIALVIALTVVIYVQTNISWTFGFVIPTICLASSILIFVIGQHTYVKVKPQGSVFSDIIRVFVAAFKKRGIKFQGGECPPPIFCDPDDGPLLQTERFRGLDKAAVIVDTDEITPLGIPKDNWRLCTVQQVEQLKCLIVVLPVGISGIVALMTMDQINVFGILQAIQMNRAVGGKGFIFPPGWLGIVSMLSLSIWIIIYEWIYLSQTKRKSRGGKNNRLSVQQRILIGIVMSIISVLISGFVEAKRRREAKNDFVSPMSIFWLFPQFVFSGLTEAFAAVAIMEFLTTQLAENMRTVAGALFFLCLSISSYTGSILVNVIHSATKRTGKSPWLGGHDLNKSRLDLYYFFLAFLAVLNLVYFTFFAKHFVMSNSSYSDTQKYDHGSESGGDSEDDPIFPP